MFQVDVLYDTRTILLLLQPYPRLTAAPLAVVYSLSLGFIYTAFVHPFSCALQIPVSVVMLSNLDSKS